ncbi:cytochrome B561 [Nitrosococcus halophilus Nc 4]|uniref:Cytochrome B561 n=1 Tax=Nitrosococcus halophilus (strain Nc4) TaxID=472759 RepID=D5C4J7_NITHN|nr:DUF3611 family protein [Nitrosococcus halophilus]ADE15181.1 cytochrome B561 [Nitrosococcus halophilus Nc 4]
MKSSPTQHSLFFTAIHWILASLIFVLIGLGWYLQYLPPTAPEREFFINLHISLGLTSVILVAFQILLWLILGSSPLLGGTSGWQKAVVWNLYLLIYGCVAIAAISGFLQATSSGIPIKFWGLSIPTWETKNSDLVGFYKALHEITAIVLTVLVIILVGVIFLKTHQRDELPPPHPPARPQQPGRRFKSKRMPSNLAKAILRLVKNLRRLGWTVFWIQFIFAIASALLLLFATSGQVLSPNELSGGLLWAFYAFVILCLSTIIFFYYTRLARKIYLEPDTYISAEKESSPWLLGLSSKVSLLGTLVSFIGMGVSISLLIAKTVSQPPGIAITDPSKIIRALDVFILVINFSLLTAHSIGTMVSIWVTILASNAHKQKLLASPHLNASSMT